MPDESAALTAVAAAIALYAKQALVMFFMSPPHNAVCSRDVIQFWHAQKTASFAQHLISSADTGYPILPSCCEKYSCK